MKTIVKSYNYIFVGVESNNNKYWRGLLYDDGTGASEFGRVGYDGQRCEYKSHAIVERKATEKLKKGYTELKTVGGPSSSTATSTHTVNNSDLREIAKSQLVKTSNPTLDRLIDRLVQANVHRITSSTQIQFNSSTGLFSTPLGIVTPDGIIEARDLLVVLNGCVSQRDWTSSKMLDAIGRYLRIVPQAVGMRLNVRDLFPDASSIQKQSDVLDSLEASYAALQTQKPAATTPTGKPVEQVFKVDLDILQNGHEYNRLVDWYEKSKKSMHGYGNIRVRQIFVVNVHEMTNAFESKTIPIQDVFHGTSMGNCLSILKSGLRISPPSTAKIAGKLFGNGVYGALSSSKSLGYTFDRWGQGGVGDAGWLFVCQFAMGKTYTTTAYGCSKPGGYDSIWAKASPNGLKNDELIVFRNSQVKITHLLEVK